MLINWLLRLPAQSQVGNRCHLAPQKQRELHDSVVLGDVQCCVYLKNIEGATVINDMSQLPSLEEAPEEYDNSSHYSSWLNTDTKCTLEPVFPSEKRTFDVSIDSDATVLHTDTLQCLLEPMRMFVAPNEHLFAPKIKHDWKGVTLHSCVNLQVGYVDK